MNNFKIICNNINKIMYSEYQLKPFKALNAKSIKANRNGYLINIEFKNIGNGYSDLFSWPELGDLDVRLLLENIKNSKFNIHTYKTIYFAYIDACYRAKNLNIFSNFTFPKNHYTEVDISLLNLKKIEKIKNDGFELIKIKLSKGEIENTEKLTRFFNNIKSSQLKIRIDFNNSLDSDLLENFLNKFYNFLNIIDFIEDPYFLFFKDREKYKSKFSLLSLAIDRLNLEDYSNNVDLNVDYFILKPAIQNFIDKKFSVPVVISSYMDHPLGQLSALYEAGLFNQGCLADKMSCGLLTHQFYEMNEYAETLTIQNTRLLPSLEGTGFGFNSLLKNEHWKELK